MTFFNFLHSAFIPLNLHQQNNRTATRSICCAPDTGSLTSKGAPGIVHNNV